MWLAWNEFKTLNWSQCFIGSSPFLGRLNPLSHFRSLEELLVLGARAHAFKWACTQTLAFVCTDEVLAGPSSWSNQSAFLNHPSLQFVGGETQLKFPASSIQNRISDPFPPINPCMLQPDDLLWHAGGGGEGKAGREVVRRRGRRERRGETSEGECI